MSGSWKVAYADFVTAMMAFFLLMWILAQVPDEKKADLAGYFKEGGQVGASGNIISPGPPGGAENAPMPMSEAEQTSVEVARYLNDRLRENNLQDQVRITPMEAGVLLRAQSGAMFDENQLELNQNGVIILNAVSQTIRQFKMNLVVRGHADSHEGTAGLNKWEISAMRAAKATAYLVNQGGVGPSVLVSVFYGDTRPLKPDSGGVASPENRRVEFFFHRPEVAVGVTGY